MWKRICMLGLLRLGAKPQLRRGRERGRRWRRFGILCGGPGGEGGGRFSFFFFLGGGGGGRGLCRGKDGGVKGGGKLP